MSIKLNKLHFSKLPPLDPGIAAELKKQGRKLEEALKKGQQSLTTPRFNFFGKCPKCGSRAYFKLYGGQKDKLCYQCQNAY